MWVSDGQQITPRGLSLHEGANQCRGILIFHLSLPRANSGGTPACRDRPRVCPPPSVRQGRNKHVIRQTTNDCECIRLPRDGRTDTGKNPRGFGQTRGLSLHAGANQCGYRADSKSPLGVLSATSQSGKNNLTLYDMLIGIKLVENVKHICRKIDHCTVDNLIRYLIISLSNSPGYTGFSIGVAVAKHSYSNCVFKRV